MDAIVLKATEARRVIELLGGTTKVARLCRVKPPSVTDWKKTGLPSARRQYLELLRPDVFGPAPVNHSEAA